MLHDETQTDYLRRIIYDLLHYRRSAIQDTAWFRDQRHNDDLCPLVEQKLDTVLSLFDRYHRTVHDIQGVRDRGIDVLLSYVPADDPDGTKCIIGFQVKSFPEIGQDGWLGKLKAQCWEAITRENLVDHYVLFCTDVAEHKDQLRNAFADISEQRKLHVTALHPEFAYTFLHLSEQQIAAYIKAKLSRDDIVFREAVDSLEHLSPTEAAVVIDLVVRHVVEGETRTTISDLQHSRFLSDVYDICPDIGNDYYTHHEDEDGEPYLPTETLDRIAAVRFEDDFAVLEGDEIQAHQHDETVMPDLDSFMALRALLLDALVRYGYRGVNLRHYMLHTLVADKLDRAEVLRGALASHG